MGIEIRRESAKSVANQMTMKTNVLARELEACMKFQACTRMGGDSGWDRQGEEITNVLPLVNFSFDWFQLILDACN